MNSEWQTKGIVLMMSLVLSLVIAEIAARGLTTEIGDTFIIEPPKELYFKYHHPGLDPELQPTPDLTSYRIMFIGDSFTLGYNCSRDKAFPYLVQEYFTKGEVDGVSAQKVQSLNLGAVSYSPSIYGAILRDMAPRFLPDLVVLAVDDSDPQDDYYYRNAVQLDSGGLPVSVYPRLIGVPQWLDGPARQLKLLRLFFAAFWPRENDPGYDPYVDDLRNRYAHYTSNIAGQARWKTAFNRTLALMDSFFTHCARNQINVALVNYPYPPAVMTKCCGRWRAKFGLTDGEIHNSVFHAQQEALASARAIPYYDFTDFLRRSGNLDGVYDEDTAHFSGHGNELLANELVRFLNEKFLSHRVN